MTDIERAEAAEPVSLQGGIKVTCAKPADTVALDATCSAEPSELSVEASVESANLTLPDEQSANISKARSGRQNRKSRLLALMLCVPLIGVLLLPNVGYITGNIEAATIVASHKINPPQDKFALWYRLYNTGMCNYGEKSFQQRKALLLLAIDEASKFGPKSDRLVESYRALGALLTGYAKDLPANAEKLSCVLQGRRHLERALSMAISLHGTRHRSLSKIYSDLASTYFTEAWLHETHKKLPGSHFNCNVCDAQSLERGQLQRKGMQFNRVNLRTALVSTGKQSNETSDAAVSAGADFWTEYKYVGCLPNSIFHRRMFQYEFPGNHDDSCTGCEDCKIYPDLFADKGTKLRVRAEIEECNGNYESAESLYQQSIAAQTQKFGDHHPMTAIALNSYACFLRGRGFKRKATPFEAQCDLIWENPTPGWTLKADDMDLGDQ